MKKICFLLAGQLRTFDNQYVEKSWEKITSYHNADMVGCFWDNRGCSVAARYNPQGSADDFLSKEKASQYLKTNYIKMYNYNKFLTNLEPHYACFKNQEMFQCIIPSTYLRYQAWQYYLSLNIQADILVLTRPDIVFLRNIDFQSLDTDYILHQNTQVSHPNRIYDMMIISNQENIGKVCSFFYDTDGSLESINKPLHNSLKKLDACRVYYNYVNAKKIPIQSLPYLYADCFRTNDDIEAYKKLYTNSEELWCNT